MKCALYVVAGAIAAPIALAVVTILVWAPMMIAEQFIGNSIWGAGFWVVMVGAFVGWVICSARAHST